MVNSNESDSTPSRKLVDWEAVEREYRVGLLSLSEIGGLHGVAKSRISVVARRDGWQRDLSKRIQLKADALVNAAAVNAGVNARRRVEDGQTVAAVATLRATVLLREREYVDGMLRLQKKLVAELVALTDNAPSLAALGEALREQSVRGQDKRHDLYMHVIGLPQRIKATKDLADMQKTTIDLEGRLFGISGGETAAGTIKDLSEDELVRRLKSLTDRLCFNRMPST